MKRRCVEQSPETKAMKKTKRVLKVKVPTSPVRAHEQTIGETGRDAEVHAVISVHDEPKGSLEPACCDYSTACDYLDLSLSLRPSWLTSPTAAPVCTHLSLGLCPCTPIQTQTQPQTHHSASSLKRKSSPEASTAATKRRRSENPEDRRWGPSTTLDLFEDSWKIKKTLTESDLGNLSRLMLPRDLAKDSVLPVLGSDARRDAETRKGTEIGIWDVDTNSMHSLVFKRWVSSNSYVFVGKWNLDFVKRRQLKKGDEVGFRWDSCNNRFDFTVLQTGESN